MKPSGPHAFTIGHSTHSMEDFLALLKRHGITAVADVRSSPHSQYNSQYDRAPLERSLHSHGIRYVYLGRELGGRSNDPSCYEGGRVQYSRLAATDAFRRGVQCLVKEAQAERIAVMCAEKEPLECHRMLLVARALVERGLDVVHILADGSLETYEDSLSRLLGLTGLSQAEFFRSREERIAEALARQERRIAYTRAKPGSGADEEAP